MQKWALSVACAIGILCLFISMRCLTNVNLNVDETIPLRVSDWMRESGTLNPNWANADLVEFLKYDQYNFYFYNIVAHISLVVGSWFGIEQLVTLRILNLLLQLAMMLVIGDCLRRLGAGTLGIAAGALSVFLFPLLAQDATMARPECLVALIASIVAWLSVSVPHRIYGPALIGFAIALGVAIKFSFFVFAAPLAIYWVVRNRVFQVQALGSTIGFGAVGGIVGIVVAMPYALVNFDVYLNGIEYLMTQYSGQHPPHSRVGLSFFAQLEWILLYFAITAGALLIFTVLGSCVVRVAREKGAVFFIAPFLLMLFYFATKSVFFERNFSQSIPTLCIAFGLVVHGVKSDLDASTRNFGYSSLAALLLFLSLGQMAYWSSTITDATERFGERRVQSENQANLVNFSEMGFAGSIHNVVPECGSIALLEYNDPWTEGQLLNLQNSGYAKIGDYKSRFSIIPTSTLHVYLDPDIHYLSKPCNSAG